MRALAQTLVVLLLAGCPAVDHPPVNHPPSVQIDSPRDGDLLGAGPFLLAGTVTDPDESIPSSQITWASDDVVIGEGSTISVSLNAGPHRLRLSAVDGQGLTSSAELSVSVDLLPPVVTITEPANGATFFEGPITFTGSASDPEGGTLTGSSLEWSSDRDGPIGTGASVTTMSLTAGAQVITLLARDSVGNTATATRSVQVLPNAAPVVTFELPNHYTYSGVATTFTATAVDPEDGPLSGTAVRWTNYSSELGTGLSVTTTLTSGTQSSFTLISVTATDSHGRSATASRDIWVCGNTYCE